SNSAFEARTFATRQTCLGSRIVMSSNDQHEPPEPAAADGQIATRLNGWLRLAPCSCWPDSYPRLSFLDDVQHEPNRKGDWSCKHSRLHGHHGQPKGNI